MTATNHALTGALVAVVFKQPAIALPVAFAMHFVMDAIPHFGLPASSVLERNSSKIFRYVLSLDVLIATILLIVLPLTLNKYVHWWIIAGCMVACASPDLVWGFRFFGELKNRKSKAMGLFSRFHKHIQWSETINGAYVEGVWFFVALLATYFLAPM